MKSLTTSTSGHFLISDGSCLTYAKLSTNDIHMAEPFKAEIAKLVKEEIEKICFELYAAGSLPLTEQAKEYFARKL